MQKREYVRTLCSVAASCPSRSRKHRMPLRRTFELLGDAAADEVAQRIDRFVGDAVVNAGAAAFARDEAVFGQRREVARDVGGGAVAQLRKLAYAALAVMQDVQDVQPRRLGQRLEVRCHLAQGFGGEVFHGHDKLSQISCRRYDKLIAYLAY